MSMNKSLTNIFPAGHKNIFSEMDCLGMIELCGGSSKMHRLLFSLTTPMDCTEY
jgi:hypothetical protein